MSTEALVKNIVNTKYENLPEEAVIATKKSVLDILGVMLPPTTLVKSCNSVYELMNDAGGKPESTLVGFGGKLPCWAAAYVNGSLTHAIDFDDCVGLEKPLVHPTGSTFPAALAVAEKVGGVSGKELITAIAVSNDLSTRLAACPKGNVVWDYPFFPITTFGIFSATAAAGKLLRFSEYEMVNAFGLALNRVSGVTKGLFGSDLRAIRDGINGREGVLCALLASKGIDGCKNAIELLFDVYYHNDVDTQHLTAGLGQHFRGSEVGFKPWPSCQGTHSYLQGILQIVNSHHIKENEVEEVVLLGNKEGQELCLPAEIKQNPSSSITAKISLPFAIGVAITRGNVSIADFLSENLKNATVLETAKKIKFELNPGLTSYASHVELKTKDGRIYRAKTDVLKGSIQDPLSVDDLIVKFRDCVRFSRKPLSTGDADFLIDNILNLEKVRDITEITRRLN